MTPTLLTVLCPQCKHQMKYGPQKPVTSKSVKRCVYCGYSMMVKNTLV